jgi:hypothetical protein
MSLRIALSYVVLSSMGFPLLFITLTVYNENNKIRQIWRRLRLLSVSDADYLDNIITMNILAHKFSVAFQPLTTSIYFMASKMQASSTQKTKDSAGRRLGYNIPHSV